MNHKKPGAGNRQGTPWKDQEGQLTYLWGEFHIETIAKKLGRTQAAVRLHAERMGLKVRPEGKTLLQLSRETGYDTPQLRILCQKLGIKLPRKPVTTPGASTRDYNIDEDTEKKIIDGLRKYGTGANGSLRFRGCWEFRDPPHCIDCGTSEGKHRCNGRCSVCDMRWRRSRKLKR